MLQGLIVAVVALVILALWKPVHQEYEKGKHLSAISIVLVVIGLGAAILSKL